MANSQSDNRYYVPNLVRENKSAANSIYSPFLPKLKRLQRGGGPKRYFENPEFNAIERERKRNVGIAKLLLTNILKSRTTFWSFGVYDGDMTNINKMVKDERRKDGNLIYSTQDSIVTIPLNIYQHDDIYLLEGKILQSIDQHKKSGRLQIDLGYVIAGKVIYPSNNTYLFDTPAGFTTKAELKKLLHDNLTRQRIQEQFEKTVFRNSDEHVIGLYRVLVKIFYNDTPIGTKTEIPQWIKSTSSIVPFANVENNMCFWWCLAKHKNPDVSDNRRFTKLAKALYDEFYGSKAEKIEDYQGIMYPSDIELIERKFNIGINAYESDDGINFTCDRSSEMENCMNLLLLNKMHFCFIRNKDNLIGKIKCTVKGCCRIFKDRHDMNKHSKTCKGSLVEQEFVFPEERRIWKGKRNEILEILDGFTDDQKQYIIKYDGSESFQQAINDYCMFSDKFSIKFDFESNLVRSDLRSSDKLKYVGQQIPVAYSMYSDAYGVQVVKIDETSNCPYELVRRFVDDLVIHRDQLFRDVKYKYWRLIDALENRDKESSKQLWKYLNQIPVVGYNSSKFDINLIVKFGLFQYLQNENSGNAVQTFTSGNTYKCVMTSHFRFVDMYAFQSPNVTLAKFLEGYLPKGVQNRKLHIDYSFSMNPNNWHLPFPPPYEKCTDFFRRDESITKEHYNLMVRDGEGCRTIGDYLNRYCSQDVEPFDRAIKSFLEFYKDAKELDGLDMIDPLKQCFGIPSLAMIFGNNYAMKGPGPYVKTFMDTPDDRECFFTMSKYRCGGMSGPMHRYHEKGLTRIRKAVFNQRTRKFDEIVDGEIVEKIISYDASALYPYAYGGQVACEYVKKVVIDDKAKFLKELLDGKHLGFISVKIEVPDSLKSDYSEYCPFFINRKVGKESKLISTLQADQLYVQHNLLIWYINHFGIECVKDVYFYHQFIYGNPFKDFVLNVADKRRMGGLASNQHKDISNSFFGKSGQDNSKHCRIVYQDKNDYLRKVGWENFKDSNCLKTPGFDDVYEIKMKKIKVKNDMPLQLALSTYQNSKLRMLEFVYDYVYKFHDRKKVQLMYTDTDSMWMALSEDSLDKCVLVGIDMKEYLIETEKFLATDLYSQKTPGKFKIETESSFMICLAPKLYTSDFKQGNKGINTKNDANSSILTKEIFKDILLNGGEIQVENRGFRTINKSMTNYIQTKTGLTANYDKRVVLDNRIMTVPHLDIW